MKIVLIKKLGVFRVGVHSQKFEHFIRNLLFMAETVKNEIAMDELAENLDGYFRTTDTSEKRVTSLLFMPTFRRLKMAFEKNCRNKVNGQKHDLPCVRLKLSKNFNTPASTLPFNTCSNRQFIP